MRQPVSPFADLAGRRAFVTGASSGLGRHFAGLLAAHGVCVHLAGRREGPIEAAAAAIRTAGGRAESVALDVADAAGVHRYLQAADPFDIIVNNAGITATVDAVDMPSGDWDRIVATNLTGVFTVAQAGAAAMIAAGREGAIVNIASILGERVAGKLAAYAATKAAVLHLTRSLALEWARHGIRVNALCPGYIETELNRDFFASEAGRRLVARIPQRRLGRPDDLDVPFLLLCSRAGAFMTGSQIVVDGGHLVSSL